MKNCFFLFVVILSITIHSQEFELSLIGPYNGGVFPERIQIHPVNSEKVLVSEYSGGIFLSEGGDIKKMIDIKGSEIPYAFFNPGNDNIIFALSSSNILKVNIINNEITVLHKNVPDLHSHFIFNSLNPMIIYNTRDGKKLYRSDDGGVEWYLLKEFDYFIESLAIATSDTSVLYAGINGYVYRSSDSGYNWTKMTQQARFKIYKIIVNPFNENSLYLLVDSSIYHSKDAGETFQRLLQHGGAGIRTFVLNPIDTLKIYAVESALAFMPDGYIYKTTDGGTNWSIINNNLPGIHVTPLTIAIDPVYPETLYVSNGGLGVFKTTNGGDSWELTKISGTSVFSLYNYPNSPYNYLAGVTGWGVLKTSDGGMNWSQPNIPGYYYRYWIRNISSNPFNPNEFLTATRFTALRSSDSGNNWFYTIAPQDVSYIYYHPSIENLVFATAINRYENLHLLWRSTDNGVNWALTSDTSSIMGYHFHPTNPDIIYGVRFSLTSKVLKSTDAGLSWLNKTNNLPQYHYPEASQCLAIDSFDPETIYVGLGTDGSIPGGLFKSTNGGDYWIRIDSTLKHFDSRLRIISILTDKYKPGRLYIGMQRYGPHYTSSYADGGLFLTEDYGKSWRKVYDGSVRSIYEDNQTARNIFINSKFGLLKFLDTLTVTSVKDEKDIAILTDYKLSQNYPNPFNPGTIISWQAPVGSLQSLKVYDVLGREVATLVNEYKEAGKHSVEFNATGLPSGVYFYRLNAGSFSETKKMILLR